MDLHSPVLLHVTRKTYNNPGNAKLTKYTISKLRASDMDGYRESNYNFNQNGSLLLPRLVGYNCLILDPEYDKLLSWHTLKVLQDSSRMPFGLITDSVMFVITLVI